MKPLNIKISALVVFLLSLQIFSFCWLKNDLDKKITTRASELEKSIENAYQATIFTYKNWANFVYAQNIMNNYEVLSYLYQGFVYSDKQRDDARKNLRHLLAPLYDELLKQKFAQLHFHFPDGTSFLRFHAPENYEDNIFDFRYSVKKANIEKSAVDGFETSRLFNGYRFVYPVFYGDQHIGSVGLSVSCEALKKNFAIYNPGEYDFIIKKSSLINAMPEEMINDYYLQSNIHKDYFFQKTENLSQKNYNEHLEHIDPATIKEIIKNLRNKIELKIKDNSNFTLFTNHDGNYYSLTLTSIKDIQNNPIAIICRLKRDSLIKSYHIFFYINIFFVFLFNTLLIIYFIILDKNRQKDIKQKQLLETTQKYLRNITDNIPDALFILDNNGQIILINNSSKKIFSDDDSFFLNKNFFDLFICLKKKYNIKKEDLFNKNHILFNTTFELSPLINLHEVFLSLRFIMLNEDTNNMQALAIISDITEHKKNIQKINIFSKLVEQTPLSIIITDKNTNIEYVNPKFTSVTGYSDIEVMGKNPKFLKSGFISREFYENFWETISSGKIWIGEFHNKKKNKELFWEWAIIFPIKNDTGEITHFAAIKEDITEKKQINEVLEKTKSQLEFLFDNLAMGVAITKDRLIYKVNKTVLQMFGYSSPDEVIGKSAEIIYPTHEQFLSFGNKFLPVLSKGEIFISDEYLMKKNKEMIWTRLFAKVINPANPQGGVMWLFEDISEQKKLQEELYISQMISEKANRAKSEFLANMSHEIRTPINAIIGMTELSLEKSTDPEQENYLKTVIDSSEFLLNLINEILDFSKIEAEKYELEIKPFSLKTLMEKIIVGLKVKAEQKNLKLLLAFDPEPLNYLLGDSHNLTKIFINIIGNAIKFTEYGDIRVDCAISNEKEDSLEIYFCVNDTGIGIPEDKLQNIFAAFSQADLSITKKFGGTGLGLTITKKLVDLMEGKITVDSKVGAGSSFCIKIPFQKGELIPDEPASAEHSENIITQDDKIFLNKQNIKILIAEDNKTNQELINIILNKQGIKTDIANNGIEALKLLSTSDYDIILTDIQMPYMDGLTAIEIIRAFEKGKNLHNKDIKDIEEKLRKKLKNKHTAIIIITAHAIQGYKEKCIKKGADDCITKPIRKKELIQVLQKFIKNDIQSDMKENNIAYNNSSSIKEKVTNHLKSSYDLSSEQIDMILQNSIIALRDLLDILNNNIISNDFENIFKTAHSLKGSLLNLGLDDIAEIAKTIEISGEAMDKNTDYPRLYSSLQENLQSFFNEE